MRKVTGLVLLIGMTTLQPLSTEAFSLLGPLKNRANHAPDPWQGRGYAGRPGGLGYELNGDIGGPMFLDEGYRWNVPTVYYGFDASFLDYFGSAGVVIVERAIGTLNALPVMSELPGDLSTFPLETIRQHAAAEAEQLLDLESWILAALLEQLGLANPERFVWGLRQPTSDPDCEFEPYCDSILRLNFDPVTLTASPYVNGVLYSFVVLDQLGPLNARWSSAVEWDSFDPERTAYSAVAGGLGNPDLELRSGSGPISDGQRLRAGIYFAGLTRDDVGGLRYLYRRDRLVRESLLPDVSGADSPGAPLVREALRGGVDRIHLARLAWDTVARSFIPAVESYADVIPAPAGGIAVTQSVQRIVSRPDILFRAEDLGGTLYFDPWLNGMPVFLPRILERGPPIRWQNHAAMNASADGGGPGVITPGGVVTLNKLGRYRANPGVQWGSFDESDRPPIVLAGSETNHAAVTLGIQMVLTNGQPHIEWSFLLNRDWNQSSFRIEESSDLKTWHATEWIDASALNPPIATRRYPASGEGRYFRVEKASTPEGALVPFGPAQGP